VCLPDAPESPWPGWAKGYAQGNAYPITLEQVVAGMDAAGIARAALQVPTWFCSRDEYAVDCAEQLPGRFAVMARARSSATPATRRDCATCSLAT
jgi:hypothetical protein